MAKEIKKLLRWMILTCKNHNYKPLYFQCPYFEDEQFICKNRDGEYFLRFELVTLPATNVDGIPITFKEGVCQLFCEDYVVMTCWREQSYSMEDGPTESFWARAMKIEIKSELKYDFTDYRFQER